MKQYDTIIFDLDGTLLNTSEDIGNSINYALNKLGLPQIKMQKVTECIGGGVRQMLQCAAPEGTDDATIDRFLERFQTHYTQHMQIKSKPYPDVMKLLSILQAENYQMSIVSNKCHEDVVVLVDVYFKNIFPFSFGESETIQRKPSPDGLLAALAALNASPEHTMYVGDSPSDIIAAKTAGMTSVAATWGYRPKDALKAEDPDYTIDTPMQLLDLLGIETEE